ncbi:hypothetical protein AAFC00_006761 [Neodothiora populina]|uniref:Uncharacterized protein n=1 Tax=Neodothiora populina TaxID=2781224 RepID=A0ABR3PBG6_9PEZI
MGFLERSRSLRRKDSATPLKKRDNSPSNKSAVQSSQQRATRDRSATVAAAAARDALRPSSTGRSLNQKEPKEDTRPRTAGRVSERENARQPPVPNMTTDYHSFKFPSAAASPRVSTSQVRNLTLNPNGSAAALAVEPQGKAPVYKRSFTTPVPQATVQGGSVKMTTKDLPKLEATPAPTGTSKRPTLHKSRSSTWKSFFSRKQSKPPVPDFDAADVPPIPTKESRNDSPLKGPSPKGTPAVSPKDSSASSALPASMDQNTKSAQKADKKHSRQESRGLARQTMRADLDKAQFEKYSQTSGSKSSESRLAALRPDMLRGKTETSIASPASSETYFDALSRRAASNPGTPMGMPPHTPRLEVSIPTVEMERYSVMFEKLLKPRQTILERRKTNVPQGLQLPADAGASNEGLRPSLDTAGVPKRRATSPNIIAPTPLTAEFLESSSQMATPVAIHRVSGVPRVQLRRSHTAPPGALSPSSAEQSLQPSKMRQQQQAALDNTASSVYCSTSGGSPMWSETSDVPATPDTTTETDTFMSLDDDEEEDDDYDDDGEEPEIVTYDTKSLRPTFKEPTWDMITPQSTQNTTSKQPTTTRSSSPPPPPIPLKAPGRSVSREASQERIQQLQQQESQFPPRSSSLGSLEARSAIARSAEGPSPRREAVKRASTLPPIQTQIQTQAQAAGPQSAHSQSAREPHPRPLQSHAVNTGRPVQTGIARTVSVRRPTTVIAAAARAGAGPRSANALSSAHHSSTLVQPVSMYSKQPLRPQLVEVRNRKSTIVVLEGSSSIISGGSSSSSKSASAVSSAAASKESLVHSAGAATATATLLP